MDFSLLILAKKLNILQIQNNSVARGFRNRYFWNNCFEIRLLLNCFIFAKYLNFKYFANTKQFSSKGISKQTWTVQISRRFLSMCLGRFSNFQNILFLGKLKCFKICVFWWNIKNSILLLLFGKRFEKYINFCIFSRFYD